MIALAASSGSPAATLTVGVFDHDGAPVADVAVYAVPGSGSGISVSDQPPQVVMDQVDLEFVPHILVVQSGTVVEFPNSDHVNHHVYSFSPAKAFELELYKGSIHPPLTFDESGIVTLGCNIHDNMLGYIVVVNTPWFAKTDAGGHAELGPIPEGRYRIQVWTPRTGSKNLPDEQEIGLQAGGDAELSFRFTSKLYPPHGQESSLTWSEY